MSAHTAPIDLSALPTPAVVEPLDFEAILSALKTDIAERMPALAEVLDLESEPVVKLLQTCAYRELLLRGRVNDAARAVMLASAVGSDLDQLAALTETLRLAGESDADLRRRAQLAWERLSVAGPAGAYRYHALSADPDVREVSVTSPAPGDVDVAVLARSGDGAPSEAVLAAVRAALTNEDVRPLTDHVTVRAVRVRRYRVRATLTLYPGPAAAPVLAAAQAALAAELERLRAPGHDVSPSALYAALHQPGVQRVQLAEPQVHLSIAPDESAYAERVDIREGPRDV